MVADPPEAHSGTFRIDVGERILEDGVGYFQLHRPLAPDWFIPFTDVANVLPLYVLLAVTEEEGPRSGWHIKPVANPNHPQVLSSGMIEKEIAPPADAGQMVRADQPVQPWKIENDRQLEAALSWADYWRQAIADGAQSWLAVEQARYELQKLHRRTEEYRQRQAQEKAATESSEAVLALR